MNELSRTTDMDLGALRTLCGARAAQARVETVTVRNSRRVAMTTSAIGALRIRVEATLCEGGETCQGKRSALVYRARIGYQNAGIVVNSWWTEGGNEARHWCGLGCRGFRRIRRSGSGADV